MPDRRQHRGPHPNDRDWFGKAQLPELRAAASELSWLLTRGYRLESALELVGNRHALVKRQRVAVARGSCSETQRTSRRHRRLPHEALRGKRVAVDGLNCLIGVEAALSGGLVFRGLDGAHRDLSSVHGTYRRVQETERAMTLILDVLASAQPEVTIWVLDRPVSNSGRIATLLRAEIEARSSNASVELANDADKVVVEPRFDVAVSSDGWVLDQAPGWFDVVGHIIAHHEPGAWKVDLSSDDEGRS